MADTGIGIGSGLVGMSEANTVLQNNGHDTEVSRVAADTWEDARCVKRVGYARELPPTPGKASVRPL